MIHLSLKGKTTIFKSLAISKIVYLALLTLVPNSVLEELKQIENKTFLWGNKRAETKHYLLCYNYTEDGLKSVDIKHRILALRYFWIQRLYNENFRKGKLISLSCKNFKFHSNLHIPSGRICTSRSCHQARIIFCATTTHLLHCSQQLFHYIYGSMQKRVVY